MLFRLESLSFVSSVLPETSKVTATTGGSASLQYYVAHALMMQQVSSNVHVYDNKIPRKCTTATLRRLYANTIVST